MDARLVWPAQSCMCITLVHHASCRSARRGRCPTQTTPQVRPLALHVCWLMVGSTTPAAVDKARFSLNCSVLRIDTLLLSHPHPPRRALPAEPHGAPRRRRLTRCLKWQWRRRQLRPGQPVFHLWLRPFHHLVRPGGGGKRGGKQRNGLGKDWDCGVIARSCRTTILGSMLRAAMLVSPTDRLPIPTCAAVLCWRWQRGRQLPFAPAGGGPCIPRLLQVRTAPARRDAGLQWEGPSMLQLLLSAWQHARVCRA